MRIRETAVLLSNLSALTACAGSAIDDRRSPSYAIAVGQDNDYEVDCGASLVIVDHFSTHHFFREDGTEKTRQEFCDEYRGDTRIGR